MKTKELALRGWLLFYDEKLTTIVSYSCQKRSMWFLTEYGIYEVNEDEKLTELIVHSGQNICTSLMSTVSMKLMKKKS